MSPSLQRSDGFYLSSVREETHTQQREIRPRLLRSSLLLVPQASIKMLGLQLIAIHAYKAMNLRQRERVRKCTSTSASTSAQAVWVSGGCQRTVRG